MSTSLPKDAAKHEISLQYLRLICNRFTQTHVYDDEEIQSRLRLHYFKLALDNRCTRVEICEALDISETIFDELLTLAEAC